MTYAAKQVSEEKWAQPQISDVYATGAMPSLLPGLTELGHAVMDAEVIG